MWHYLYLEDGAGAMLLIISRYALLLKVDPGWLLESSDPQNFLTASPPPRSRPLSPAPLHTFQVAMADQGVYG